MRQCVDRTDIFMIWEEKAIGQYEKNKQPKDKSKTDDRAKYHYCVLYTQVLKQWEVTQVIRKALPEGRGIVFYPCVELWWNGLEENVIKPLFPGYVFIRSDMKPAELHDMIRRHRGEVLSFVKELHVSGKKAVGEDPFAGEDRGPAVFDLSDDEAEFLDFMLNFRYGDDERKKVLDVGVLRMSYGYREGKKYVVMEGPLKGYEHHIADVNARDRKAYLDIKINGQAVRAGLELRGKKYWFPDDVHASAILEDGTEINPVEIAKLMMG